ncbi:hypothetical protein [Bacillus wiedmannii]|uniref:hypothetical protein n=1 Tax=Bacillus wiedmannii TaxID=1890302 RepID=UPI000BFB15F2|nr:hypothetical protein [Bacillus wiedmannii]PHA62871.1 hypothetical protein COE75_16690 [Bacillus wiedmannii]
MAYVNTDSTYYGKGSTSVDITTSMVPYNTANLSYCDIWLQRTTGPVIVADKRVGMAGKPTFSHSIGIKNSDPRGSYQVHVFYRASTGAQIVKVSSGTIYLT